MPLLECYHPFLNFSNYPRYLRTFHTNLNYFLWCSSTVVLAPHSVRIILLLSRLRHQLGGQRFFGQQSISPLRVGHYSYVLQLGLSAYTRFFQSLTICVFRSCAIFMPFPPSPVLPFVPHPPPSLLFSCWSPYLLLLPSLSVEWVRPPSFAFIL